MGRQIGTVLGVAGLVAILSRVSRTDPVAAYRHGLVLVIAFFAAAGAASAVLLTARPVTARGSEVDQPLALASAALAEAGEQAGPGLAVAPHDVSGELIEG
jgi:hypothetical protein